MKATGSDDGSDAANDDINVVFFIDEDNDHSRCNENNNTNNNNILITNEQHARIKASTNHHTKSSSSSSMMLLFTRRFWLGSMALMLVFLSAVHYRPTITITTNATTTTTTSTWTGSGPVFRTISTTTTTTTGNDTKATNNAYNINNNNNNKNNKIGVDVDDNDNNGHEDDHDNDETGEGDEYDDDEDDDGIVIDDDKVAAAVAAGKVVVVPTSWKYRSPSIVPCFPPDEMLWLWSDDEEDDNMIVTGGGGGMEALSVDTGIIFIRPFKVASSTSASITLRIARNVARRRQQQPQRIIVGSDGNHRESSGVDLSRTGFPMCQVNFLHGTAETKCPRRDRAQSFLWTILRDPTERAISMYYHFVVSRRKMKPDDEHFQHWLTSPRLRNYYLNTLSTTGFDPSGKTKEPSKGGTNDGDDPIQIINSILDEYDFIGITERLEESVVVMMMLLNLSVSDVLHLNIKVNGGYDGGHGVNHCTYIKPRKGGISKNMKRFFVTNKKWHNQIRYDKMLYDAVNRSLDNTIRKLDSKTFETNLIRYRHAQEVIGERCIAGKPPPPTTTTTTTTTKQHSSNITIKEVKLPCSDATDGDLPLEDDETDCMYIDLGCGMDCIDMVADDLDLW